MSEEPNPLKDLIDDIEADDKSRSELIQENENLNDEIERLKVLIEEQEKLLQKSNNIEIVEFEGSEDIQILKEMIFSQRQALNEKDDEINYLKERNALIDEYNRENEDLKALKSQLSDAKATIEKLTNAINMHKTNEENAKELIIKLTEEKNTYERYEEDALRIIEELSEKKEKYKSKVKELELSSEDINYSTADDKDHLINEYESEKEDLMIKNIKNVKKINDLEQQVEKLLASQKSYEKKINALEEKLEYVKHSAIEEVAEFDDEREKIVNDYEHKIKNLENKITNMENSFIEIKTTLEAEINKYKNRIIELQKQIQKLMKTGEHEEHGRFINVDTKEKIETQAGVEAIPESGIEEPLVGGAGDTSTQHLDSEPELLTSEPEGPIYEEHQFTNEPFIDSIRKCPKCGNQKKNLIREELDKTNIIMAYPRMYGKKYVCGAFGCGCNWRIKNEKIEIL